MIKGIILAGMLMCDAEVAPYDTYWKCSNYDPQILVVILSNDEHESRYNYSHHTIAGCEEAAMQVKKHHAHHQVVDPGGMKLMSALCYDVDTFQIEQPQPH